MNYVLGACFNTARTALVLIKKNRPEWQAGRLNLVGGKIEPNERSTKAMVREFYEETGVYTNEDEWDEFAIMHGTDWQKDSYSQTLASVRCFELASDDYFNRAKTTEDEKIVKINLGYIPIISTLLIPNLKVLIPLALCREYQRSVNLVWSAETLKRVNSGAKRL